MLDINLIRENSAMIRVNLSRRYKSDIIQFFDELVHLDPQWRKLKGESDELRKERNQLSENINEFKKQKKPLDAVLKRAKEIPARLAEIEVLLKAQEARREWLLMRIPNVIHDSVPDGKTGDDNPEVKRWGKPKKFDFDIKVHSELVEELGFADFEQGRIVAGQGFNYLKGELAMLDLALQRYGIEFLLKRGFSPIIPPMMLNQETLSGAVDLSAFQEVIYKIEGEDLFMIGTAEHSLVSMMKNKIFDKKQLPLKVCAVTPCFRKEIGGHGVDMKGLFRMHQFNKVEQVVYCAPEDSFKMLEEMQSITEDFFKSLKIPFRVIQICSGDLGGKFAKQYDIEAWFPRQDSYREVTSAGNCTDYQARRLNIRFSQGQDGLKPVHILNNTMVATSRAMVAILENYQNKDGTVTVPEILLPYMNGVKKIGMKK